MTAAAFYRLVLALWGEQWRPQLTALLTEHGHTQTRQTLWNWQKGNRRVPQHVEDVLLTEKQSRKKKHDGASRTHSSTR